MMRRQQDQQSKVLEQLSSLILNIIRSPPAPIEFYDDSSMSPSSSGRRMAIAGSMQQITPAGFASLLLGISFALMICGSVTFFIGFLMMPWVLALVMLFYVAGIVYSLTMNDWTSYFLSFIFSLLTKKRFSPLETFLKQFKHLNGD